MVSMLQCNLKSCFLGGEINLSGSLVATEGANLVVCVNLTSSGNNLSRDINVTLNTMDGKAGMLSCLLLYIISQCNHV